VRTHRVRGKRTRRPEDDGSRTNRVSAA
jgi:hypothetical protein